MGCSECEYSEICERMPEDMSCDDIARYAEASLWDSAREGFEADLDMGFDPYLGCYTDDV